MKIVEGIYRSTESQSLAHSERGFAMVEVLVALALLGITGVSFLVALTTVSKSTIIADKHSAADSLAVSQIEYILSQDYDNTNNPPQYAPLPDIPEGYSVNVVTERLDAENDGTDDDDGIQEISAIVNFGSKQIVTLTSRKINIAYVP